MFGLAVTFAPRAARADGDPGVAELDFQSLYFGPGDDLSAAQQTQLNRLLDATVVLGAPVRVAVIGQRQDLGTAAAYWGRPTAYARFLGTELALAYSGRLIVVMPQGVASFHYRHGVEDLSGISTGTGPARLTAAARAATIAVAGQAGISAAQLLHEASAGNLAAATVTANAGQAEPTGAIAASGGASSSGATGPGAAAGTVPAAGESAGANTGSGGANPVAVIAAAALLLILILLGPGLWRRRGRLGRSRLALPGVGVGIVAVGALVVLALPRGGGGGGGGGASQAQALAFNPTVATPTSLGDSVPAPNFTLTDESGHRISLSQYRGKVVILAFTDAECQTICPLTTQAMVDARAALGPAAKDVQLLGVNANWQSTSIDDVANYSRLHGLLGQWHFLTGSLGQLERVWRQYKVAQNVNRRSTIINHDPALYVIGPNGKMADAFLTYASYAAIGQFGQVLAQTAAGLLPGHPKVLSHLSYSPIRGLSPSTPASLPRVGGGTITVGRGRPHLYLFFDTWDQQSTPIAAQMQRLNAYARDARRLGLPPLTAIDEATVEPNPRALSRFLAGLHLDYPVAIDTSGRVADGYGVQGEPWFTLAVPGAHDSVAQPDAQIPWSQEIYTQGWISLHQLKAYVRAALAPAPPAPHAALVAHDLAGSPPALAALHRQASRILPGGAAALVRRLRELRGRPVVVNVWGSWCPPCRQEFPLFATASAIYGKRVAFLGVDYNEPTTAAGAQFLASHQVSYPSYAVSDGDFPSALLPGGVAGTPTTIFITPTGRVLSARISEYQSQQALDQDIEAYALNH
ncbi:MAG TPA: redoxin domain-containing protein [Solirubrobacteraceae bacterium]|nr:redoxin domain-containing protein [Solirubrobacteraceae bacterium]